MSPFGDTFPPLVFLAKSRAQFDSWTLMNRLEAGRQHDAWCKNSPANTAQQLQLEKVSSCTGSPDGIHGNKPVGATGAVWAWKLHKDLAWAKAKYFAGLLTVLSSCFTWNGWKTKKKIRSSGELLHLKLLENPKEYSTFEVAMIGVHVRIFPRQKQSCQACSSWTIYQFKTKFLTILHMLNSNFEL